MKQSYQTFTPYPQMYSMPIKQPFETQPLDKYSSMFVHPDNFDQNPHSKLTPEVFEIP